MDSVSMKVLAVLERWYPDVGIVVSRAGTGVSTPVFRVLIEGKTFWARLGEEPGERRDGEVAAHHLMAACGLPIPSVVWYEAVPPELDRSIALTENTPGVPLSSLQPDPWLSDVAIEAGRVLAQINDIEVSGLGWAYAAEVQGSPVGACPSRDEWVREYLEALRRVQASGVLPVSTIRAVAGAVESWSQEPDRAMGWLAHGDFDVSHVYVDPERAILTGAIDFGELRSADRWYDLGHLLLHDGESARPALFPDVLSGYGEISQLPDDAMERIRIQAIVIGTRALAIQLVRPPSSYREWLAKRLVALAGAEREHDGVRKWTERV